MIRCEPEEQFVSDDRLINPQNAGVLIMANGLYGWFSGIHHRSE